MGMVKLTTANKKTLAKRQNMVAKATEKAVAKATAKTAPKVEPLKEPTVAELKVFADLLKSGKKAYLFATPKVTLEGTKLGLAWANGTAMENPIEALWSVKAIVTKSPTVETAPTDGYYIKTRTLDDGSVVVHFFKAPGKTSFCHSTHNTTMVDKVKWINEGKPCGYRYGFAFKGASSHRITTGEAKERMLNHKYDECDTEGGVLMFQEYSAADME
jgi:hypothetical protein